MRGINNMAINWLMAILAVSSPATKMLGRYTQGLAESYAAEYNEALLRHKATYSKRAARVAEKDLRDQVAGVIGAARAQAGASGFAMESESTQSAIDAIVRSGELDAAMIIHRGDIGAWEAEAEETLVRQRKKAGEAATKLDVFARIPLESAQTAVSWFAAK